MSRKTNTVTCIFRHFIKVALKLDKAHENYKV